MRTTTELKSYFFGAKADGVNQYSVNICNTKYVNSVNMNDMYGNFLFYPDSINDQDKKSDTFL